VIDHSGRTPLHLVEQMYSKNKEIIQILRDEIQKNNPKFFETYDPKAIRAAPPTVIFSSLSEEEKKAVLDSDISLAGIARKIQKGAVKNILVLTGAGLSTSAGIPDFRSKDGLYSNNRLKETLGKPPSSVLTLSAFRDDPESFYALLREVFLPMRSCNPTLGHKLIAVLNKRGLLLRNYTQNIDALERKAGVPAEKVVEAHGTTASATCLNCRKRFTNMDSYWAEVEAGGIPVCDTCQGPIKLDVVLFGEAMPPRFFDSQKEDLSKCDLLIVIGTSLQVYPFAGLVNMVREDVPRLLFNNEAVGAFTKGAKYGLDEQQNLKVIHKGENGTYRDVAMVGDINVGIEKFVKLLGWEVELENL